MNPGDRVRLKGTDRIYVVVRLETHYQDVPEWTNEWAVLTPPTGTHTAHWPVNQLEPA